MDYSKTSHDWKRISKKSDFKKYIKSFQVRPKKKAFYVCIRCRSIVNSGIPPEADLLVMCMISDDMNSTNYALLSCSEIIVKNIMKE